MQFAEFHLHAWIEPSGTWAGPSLPDLDCSLLYDGYSGVLLTAVTEDSFNAHFYRVVPAGDAYLMNLGTYQIP
jgi:hypothetical protein